MRRLMVIVSVLVMVAGLFAGSHVNTVAAQELADHPIVGAWVILNPGNPPNVSPAIFSADGTVSIAGVPSYVDPDLGVVFEGTAIGVWEPTGERSLHVTFVQALSDVDGTYLGTLAVDGYPEVSADGQSFFDDGTRVHVTVRDATNAIVMEAGGQEGETPVTPPVHAVRMQVGDPGLAAFAPKATPMATPATDLTADEGQMAHLNGVDLYYEVHGPTDGPPVLLLHGGLDNTETFDGLVPALVAAGYRTIAMDCRGRGRSTWGEAPITYELMADDALALLDELGIEQVDLVGESDGGILGLELGIHHPERLHRVVVFGANFTPDGVHDPGPDPEFDAFFEKLVADYQRLSPEPERFDELLTELVALYEVAPNYSEDELRSITVPMLIMDGAEEEFINPDQPVRMAELIPGAELVIMPGTGHMAPFEQPEEFNRIVLDFLHG